MCGVEGPRVCIGLRGGAEPILDVHVQQATACLRCCRLGATRRQELPPVYVLNGAAYVADVTWLSVARTFLTPETVAAQMPIDRSLMSIPNRRSNIPTTIFARLPNTMISLLKPVYRELRFRLAEDRSEAALKKEAEDLSEQWKSIVDNSQDVLRQERNNKHVLFVSGYGLGTHYLTIQPIVMMALYARGCRITSLYCNRSLPSCEFQCFRK